jgi:ATP-dependent exoDNAse (exonuclease V) beta subunit
MKPILHKVLSNKNSHPRDANIQFIEEGHKYIILTEPEVKYTSVTTWNHEHFEKFDADKIIENMMKSKSWKKGHKYWGLTTEQIKTQWDSNRDSVAGAGTALHYEIECFYNDNSFYFDYTNNELYDNYINYNKETHEFKSIEWKYFINFIRDYPQLKPYRTEWLIYDDDVKISGSIDMVYINPDNTLSIYDWKRSKNITRINNFNRFGLKPDICHLPDSNFWHYALQLNTYKTILERKYNIKVKDLFLVRLHPDAEEKNYELIELPDLSKEIEQLFKERKKELIKQTA